MHRAAEAHMLISVLVPHAKTHVKSDKHMAYICMYVCVCVCVCVCLCLYMCVCICVHLTLGMGYTVAAGGCVAVDGRVVRVSRAVFPLAPPLPPAACSRAQPFRTCYGRPPHTLCASSLSGDSPARMIRLAGGRSVR
jgi:hypothetical protein